jgi:hypothetical protein
VKKVEIVSLASSGRTFGDVGRHGISSAPELSGQTVDLLFRKCLRPFIDGNCQVVRQLPGIDLRIVTHL